MKGLWETAVAVMVCWLLSLGFVAALEAGDKAREMEAEECGWKVIRQWRDGAFTAPQANRLLARCNSNWRVR